MSGITGVVLTRNEEKQIKSTIQSLNFCKEIVVIDDNSTDNTVNIAKKLGAIIYQRSLKTDFASQRNFAMEKASFNWILFIDADEELTKELKMEIEDTIKNKIFNAYAIKRRDFWMDKELKFGETRKARNTGIIRLINKKSGQWFGNVHEVFNTSKKVGRLNNYLNHYPHPTVTNFINDINFYSTLRAKELFNHGINTNLFQIFIYPLFKFILTYFIYLGFLDGVPGFVYSFFMSFHSFLVRAKLYQYWNVDCHKNT